MVVLLNFPPPEEGVHHAEPNTRAYYDKKLLGKGTLYISESVFCWLSCDGEGFSLKYQSIYIHAVSTDENNFPEPCLYLMVDPRIKIGEPNEDGEDIAGALNSLSVEEGEDEEMGKSTELFFVPENKNMLDVMFRAVMDCQALNPDPKEAEEEDDEDDGVVIAPPFNIQVGNVEDFDEEYEEVDSDDMNEDQFEDAEP